MKLETNGILCAAVSELKIKHNFNSSQILILIETTACSEIIGAYLRCKRCKRIINGYRLSKPTEEIASLADLYTFLSHMDKAKQITTETNR